MDDADRSPMPASESKNMKRKQVAVACFACQKRKSKCDGSRPQCQACIKKGTDCAFDTDGDSRRTENLKRKIMALGLQNDADATTIKRYQSAINGYEAVINSLKSSSQEAALKIIRCLQNADTLDEVVEYCEKSGLLSTRNGIQDQATSSRSHNPHTSALEARIVEFEGYLQNLKTSAPERVIEQLQQLPRLSCFGSGVEFTPGPGSSHGKVENPYRGSERSERKNDMNFLLNPVVEVPKGSEYESWTDIVDDPMVVQHLLDIYFTWYHSSAPVFSESLFRQDMIQGKNEYCSRVLVNAILSLACYLPEQPGAGRFVKVKSETAVEFLNEAERLFFEAPEPSLMNIAALTIMAAVEIQRCRFGPAWIYSRQASSMAIYLHLHQRAHSMESTNETNRCLTFWTVFQLDQFTSAIFKRSPAMILHNVGIEVPSDNTQFETAAWPGKAFVEELPPRPRMESRYMNFASRLSKIVNVALDAYYAANYVYTPETMLKIYKEYQSWYEELQVELPIETGSPPHVFSLHMWYHSCVINLLRPILETEPPSTSIDHRDICRHAALTISHLFRCYVNFFQLRGLHNQIGIAMLEACTVHVRFLLYSIQYGPKARECLEQAIGTYELLQSRIPLGGAIVHEITGLIDASGVNLGPHIGLYDDEDALRHPIDHVNRPAEKLEWKDPEIGPIEVKRKPQILKYDHFYKPKELETFD